jgi:hypothetical protein
MAMALREAALSPVGSGPGKTVPGTLVYRGADWFYQYLFVQEAEDRITAPLVSTVSRARCCTPRARTPPL